MKRPSATFALLVCALTVLGACGSESEAPPPAGGETGGDPELRQLFADYRAAMRAGDLDALAELLSRDKAEQLKTPEARQLMPLIRSMVPAEEEVGEFVVDGDRATLSLTAESDGRPARGTVHFVREDGAWKVEKESWRQGDAVGDPDVVAEPEDEPVERIPPPDGEWSLDLAAAAVPDRPASGRMKGTDFHVVTADLQQGTILTLRNGRQFEGDASFTVFLFLRGEAQDQGVAGRSFAIGAKQDFGAPAGAHVHIRFPTEDASTPGVDSVTEGFALRLEFGEERDGKLPGRIYLSYPDDEHSYVAGTFTAVIR